MTRNEMYSIREHWSYFYTDLENITQLIESINVKNVPETVAKSIEARNQIQTVLALAHNQSLFKVGRVNVTSDLNYMMTAIRGIEDGVGYSEFAKAATNIFREISKRLESIKEEVAKKAELFTIPDAPPLNPIVPEEPDPQLTKESSYSTFIAAMKQVMNNMKEREVKEASPESKSIILTPEERLFNTIEGRKQTDAMRIAEETITLNNNAYTIVKGSLIINQSLNKNKLKDLVDFTEVVTPGVKYGFQRRESLPSHFILYDQTLVAIRVNTGRFLFSRKGPLSPKEKFIREFRIMDALRLEAISELEKQQGQVVDTLIYLPSSFLSSAKLPGIRFLWMPRGDLYRNIGSPSADKIRLGF